MPDNPSAKGPSKLHQYLRGAFRFDQDQNTIELRVRSRVKGIFDLLRNIMIVGVFFFVAEIADNLILKGLGFLGLSALCVYLFSYLEPLMFRPFHFLENEKLAHRLDVIVNLVILVTVGLGIIGGIWRSVSAIAQAYVGN